MKNRLLSFCDRFFRLFPRGFRDRFGEEMRLDFADHLEEGGNKGITACLRFLLREARDLPVNLLRAHLEESGMLRILRSQPVSNSLRGAALFGAAFALAGMIGTWALQTMLAPESFIPRLQVLYFDTFHTEHGMELIAMIPSWLSSLASGIAVGAMLAFLFGKRSKTSRYMLAGMLGWFLHDAAHQMFVMPADLYFFLGSLHSTYLTYTLNVLSGAFLGLIFVAAESEGPQILRWLAAGSVAYPLIAYVYMRVLLQLSIIETPGLFIAMMILVILYLASIFFVAIKSDLGKKAPWTVVAGAAAIILSQFLAGQVIRLFFPSLFRRIENINEFSLALLFKFAALDAIYGILFGLLLGLVLGIQRRVRPPLPAG